MKQILIIFLLACCSSAAHSQIKLDELKSFIDEVQPDSIKRHIAYLADDRMKGRLPGTPEFKLAADYVVQHYKAFGMKPAGDKGSFVGAVQRGRREQESRQDAGA